LTGFFFFFFFFFFSCPNFKRGGALAPPMDEPPLVTRQSQCNADDSIWPKCKVDHQPEECTFLYSYCPLCHRVGFRAKSFSSGRNQHTIKFSLRNFKYFMWPFTVAATTSKDAFRVPEMLFTWIQTGNIGMGSCYSSRLSCPFLYFRNCIQGNACRGTPGKVGTMLEQYWCICMCLLVLLLLL